MSIYDLYTKKQIEILKRTRDKDFFILGLHGAKRTGKTVINNDIFLRELRRVRKIADNLKIKEPMYILAGVSSKTIQNNILQELYNRYELDIKFDRHNSFTLFGVKVVQAFTGTIGGLGGIRGMTSFGAYINEASLANETVFKEIISRCSGEGARIVFDTNPDNPEHWLKKEYIDSDSENIISYHFELDDNTFLSERYIKNIKESTPTGMFYDRDIKGLWVTGEGVVYKDFDQNKHYFDDKDTPKIFKKYIAGIDWGYDHYGSIVVIGVTPENKYYLLEEIAERYKEIDFYLGKAKEISKKYRGITFYCDSARPEYVRKLQDNYLNAENADKAVLSGIEAVSKLFKTDSFFIISKVKRFREEIYNYIWHNTKDEPVKQYDDVLDAIRYAIYSYQTKQRAKVIDRSIFGL